MSFGIELVIGAGRCCWQPLSDRGQKNAAGQQTGWKIILIDEPQHRTPAAAAPNRMAQRPRELQDGLNLYVFHPLARRLALLLTNTPITPNMVSVAGGMLVVAAALAYVQPGWPLPALVGFALHLAWHVVDGADGDLARRTGRASPRGELIDGICDYASHIILYLMLGALLQKEIGPVAWFWTIGAGASRILQANHYEVQRRQYQWWLYGVPWLRSTRSDRTSQGIGAWLGAGYLRLAQVLAPHAIAADAAVAEARRDPRGLADLQDAIRRHAMPMLASLAPLGANYRTIALGLSMLAGSPLYFFVYEALILNLVALRSIRISNRSTSRLIADLHHAATSARR